MYQKSSNITFDAIKVSRVVCIFFVMYVHVYSGHGANLPIMSKFDASDVYYHFFMDVLGRSSVPLLSIISGWLYVNSAEKTYFSLVWAKFQTLLIPLFIWNIITLTLVFAYAILTGKADHLPRDVASLTNALLAISRSPINIQLGFLRDLFVIFLLSPLILPLVKRGGIFVLIATALFCVMVPYTPILLRTQLLFFFSLGIYLARKETIRIPISLVAVALIVLAVLFTTSMFAVAQRQPAFDFFGRELILRLSVAVIVWHVAVQVSQRAGSSIMRLEPFAFLAFCSHVLFFRAFSLIGVKIFGGLASPLYPIYFTIQPFLGFAVAVVFGTYMVRVAPNLLRLLNAGKLLPLQIPKLRVKISQSKIAIRN